MIIISMLFITIFIFILQFFFLSLYFFVSSFSFFFNILSLHSSYSYVNISLSLFSLSAVLNIYPSQLIWNLTFIILFHSILFYSTWFNSNFEFIYLIAESDDVINSKLELECVTLRIEIKELNLKAKLSSDLGESFSLI